jgi:hypothetical protein
MYYKHKEIELLSFEEKEGYKTIVGFWALSLEKKLSCKQEIEALFGLSFRKDLERLENLLLENISFIHLFHDGLLFQVQDSKLAMYVKQALVFEEMLKKWYFFLCQEKKPESLAYANLLNYLSFLKEEKKKALVLKKEDKKMEALVEFEASETEQQKFERLLLEELKSKASSELKEEEEMSLVETYALKDFSSYYWETYRKEEGKFPLFESAEDLFEVNKILLGFSTFEGNPPSDLVLTFWKTYYKDKDLKAYLQETLTIQQKLRSLYD